ncbi:MAG: hypothetical protein JNL18_17145 [Planctomycetaceae bacterium]|nr:hypothetical protein [Planctomycetaceae bacterium]
MMKAVNDASNNAENLSKFGAVFAEHTAQAQAFTADLADTIGRSESEIRTALSAYQAFGIGLGFSKDKSYELSTTMEKLSLDFAAFHNIQDDEAMQRFVSAMSGSSEVLDQFGINIRQAALQEELFAMGINKSVTEATEAEKTMARLNIVMEAMGEQGAVGAAARESGSFANQLKGLKAEALDLSIAVGNDLMPMALDTLKWLKGLVTQAGAAEGGMTSIGSAFLTVADVLHTLGIGFQGLQAAITRIIATSISGINRLVQSIPGAGKLGVADVTQSAADTFQAEAKKQDAEYFAALEAQTPSEKWANREAAAPPPEIEREVKKLAMEATVDLNKAFSDAAKSFGSEVVDYGELFGLKISNFGYSWMMDAVNLYNNPAKVDGFAKASAGTAVEFGSAESIISQSQKTGEDSIEKNTKELVVNAYAQKRLQEKTAAATEGIFKSFGSLISIPR